MPKKTWYEAFKGWGNTIFTEKHFLICKEMVIQDLKFYGKYIKNGAKILDMGCGIGSTAVSLSALGYNIVGIDNDKKIVEIVRQNAKNFGGKIRIIEKDVFDVDKIFKNDSFDACYSGGVLEHFDEDEIRKLIRLQLKLAPVVLADMPVKTKATMQHYRITEENAVGNIAPDGIYRNVWSEEYWIKNIFRGFNVVDHIVKRMHPSIGNFDILCVVIKRRDTS